MKKFKRGFTLIELLVVIAIIGILASVVLASLNSARKKSRDAAIMSQVSSARAQAALYYDEKGTYEGVCSVASDMNGLKDLTLQSILKYTGGTTLSYNPSSDIQGTSIPPTGTGGIGACHDRAEEWVVFVPLVAQVGKGYCVDVRNNTMVTTNALPGNIYQCS